MAIAFKVFGFKSLFLTGLAAVVLGYLTLKGGSMTLAPALLVVGYCVLIPTALFRLGHSGPGPGAGERKGAGAGRREGE
ncbi:MAG: hypothetical protein R3C71_04310 [Candidatus Krumholzibacteriia bacterium]|nr:hypothetical protein [bacterium]MCB9513159.1 hypothetical protein [Candidatus Latescibacterota bacterium]MCB9514623.1 hypothetical protein [Candidatus Latescibacterota bacterium]